MKRVLLGGSVLLLIGSSGFAVDARRAPPSVSIDSAQHERLAVRHMYEEAMVCLARVQALGVNNLSPLTCLDELDRYKALALASRAQP